MLWKQLFWWVFNVLPLKKIKTNRTFSKIKKHNLLTPCSKSLNKATNDAQNKCFDMFWDLLKCCFLYYSLTFSFLFQFLTPSLLSASAGPMVYYSPNKRSLRGPGGVGRGVVCDRRRFLGNGRWPPLALALSLALSPVVPGVSRKSNTTLGAKF